MTFDSIIETLSPRLSCIWVTLFVGGLVIDRFYLFAIDRDWHYKKFFIEGARCVTAIPYSSTFVIGIDWAVYFCKSLSQALCVDKIIHLSSLLSDLCLKFCSFARLLLWFFQRKGSSLRVFKVEIFLHNSQLLTQLFVFELVHYFLHFICHFLKIYS